MSRGQSIEQIAKDQERNENMATVMTQLDPLTKHIMGGGHKSVNVVGCASSLPFDDVPYEAKYDEVVYYMGNQGLILDRPFQGHLGIKVRTMIVVGVKESGQIE